MLNSNVGSRKQIKQERNWVLGKGTGEGFYEKKNESKSRLKRKECKALWLSGEMISEVKDKINVKNLGKKTCEVQQEAGVPGMDHWGSPPLPSWLQDPCWMIYNRAINTSQCDGVVIAEGPYFFNFDPLRWCSLHPHNLLYFKSAFPTLCITLWGWTMCSLGLWAVVYKPVSELRKDLVTFSVHRRYQSFEALWHTDFWCAFNIYLLSKFMLELNINVIVIKILILPISWTWTLQPWNC